MGFTPASAAEVAELRARIERLEREFALLQRQSTAESASPVPIAPPPLPPAQPPPLHPEQESSRTILAASSPRASSSLEDRIGSQLFNRIGILAVLVGVTLFLKLAMDNHWIGPLGRVAVGLFAGTGLVLWSERFRRQGVRAFAYSLKAVGTGVLYLSLWASLQLYHLLPAAVVFLAMVLVTAWNGYMAWSQSAELLAAYALLGGLLTPALLSTGGNHESFLFGYLLVLNLAVTVLVRLRPWPRLLLPALGATIAYFIVWYISWYGPLGAHAPLALTTVFLLLFSAVFAAVPIGRRVEGPSIPCDILVPLANAVFLALALYSVFEDAGHHPWLPWLALALAALYLGLMRLPQTAVASAVHLSLAVLFLTVAIPLKASGDWMFIGWFAEGAALLWASARLSGEATGPASRVLRWLACLALSLGLLGLLLLLAVDFQRTAFLNSRFATALCGLAAFALSLWIALRARTAHPGQSIWPHIAAAATIAFNLIAVLATVREIQTLWRPAAGSSPVQLRQALAVSAFLMLYGAALLAVGFAHRSALLRWQALVLLVLTILKVFLYDLHTLSQGYRAVSFLGLGILLLAVSFAYQKDWLSLRNPEGRR